MYARRAEVQVRADEILRALHKKHTENIRSSAAFFTQVRNGPTQSARRGELRIIDGLAVRKSWAQPCLTGYEVKVSRSDFMSDTKWPDYLPMCHELYFACPSGLIQPDEVGEEVGLIWYNPETQSLTTRKKAVYRRIELSADMLYHILMSHCDNGGHPFFSSKREMFEAWLADKRSRSDMGYAVKGKLWSQLLEQENELQDLRRKLDSEWEQPKRELEKIQAVLREAGIDPYRWGWEERLRELLSRGVTAVILDHVRDIERATSSLRRAVERTFVNTGGASDER